MMSSNLYNPEGIVFEECIPVLMLRIGRRAAFVASCAQVFEPFLLTTTKRFGAFAPGIQSTLVA